jgi:hypothetical protein
MLDCVWEERVLDLFVISTVKVPYRELEKRMGIRIVDMINQNIRSRLRIQTTDLSCRSANSSIFTRLIRSVLRFSADRRSPSSSAILAYDSVMDNRGRTNKEPDQTEYHGDQKCI